jgi:hypothetical protein
MGDDGNAARRPQADAQQATDRHGMAWVVGSAGAGWPGEMPRPGGFPVVSCPVLSCPVLSCPVSAARCQLLWGSAARACRAAATVPACSSLSLTGP